MAISLNDHENRIKNFEAKLPDISNRITNLENNPSVEIIKIDMASITGCQLYGHNGSSQDITSKFKGFTSRSYLSIHNFKTNFLYNFWIGYKNMSDIGLTKSKSLTITVDTSTTGNENFTFSINNGKIVISVNNHNFGNNIGIKFSGTAYIVNANNLYYKLLDRVSSLFSEVISCLSA